MGGLSRRAGLARGCGETWFEVREDADARVTKILGMALPGAAQAYEIVPCGHPGRGSGFHIKATPAPAAPVTVPATPARQPSGFTQRTRLVIRTRAGQGDPADAVCEACGRWLGRDDGEMQHREARGMGGCRLAVVNGPAGGCLLCGSGAAKTGCHGLAETRDEDMNLMGFWLRHGQDPVTTPIRLHGRSGGTRRVLLPPDGGPYIDLPPAAEAA